MRNQQNGRNPQAGQLSSPYQIRELKERLDSVEVDQESLKSQVDNVEKKAEESASGSGESGTNATFLYLRAQDGPAIKNSSGSVTFDIMKVEGNDSADVYQGSDFDIRNYDPTKPGASGQNFGQQVTLNASDIDGKQSLYLCVSDGSEVVDTDTAVDITDGQGGGYVEAVTPVTATYLQQDASFTISPLKVRGYFYKTGTTTNPEIARVQLYPTYDGSLKATYTKTKDLDSDGTSPISVSVQNQNGNALNEGQSATAKLAREVVVKFTYEDPNTSQTAVATETLYLTTETGPGDYVSYVFQRSDNQPSRPANSAGGTYNNPSVPTDWSDAPPVGEKRLWLSKATYEYASDGPVDTDEDGNVWSTPVRLKGEDSGLFTLFASKPKPTDPSKTNISGRPGSTTWSGSADWKTTPNDLSTDAYYMARAVWKNESWQSFDVTRIKGEKGDAAQIVRIDASSQVFTLQKDGTHAPSSITLRAVQQNIDNPTFEWTYNGSTTQSTNVSILPEDLGEDGTVSVTLSEVGTSNSDEITLVRVTEGADASTVVLSNQNHTYPADQDGNVDSSLFSKGASEIEAYVGASRANVLQSRLGAASASQKGGTTTSGFAHVLYDGSASNLGLSSGDDVTFVGEIRTAQNTSQSGRLLVEFWDGSGGKISDIKSDLENSTEWQSLSTNGAVPTGTNRIVLGYAVESVSSGNEQLVEGRYGSIHKSTQPLPAYNAYISETNINGSVDRSQPQTISYEPSGSMTNDRASALVTFKIVREDGEVEARDKQIEYSKARAGTDSEVLSLSASSQVFAVNKSGNVSTQNPISLLVNQQNISSSVTWKTKNADGTDSPVTLTSKSDSLAELSYSDLENAGKQQVTVRAEAGGYSDEVTIAIVREGKDAVTALLSNENHSYSASSDGSVSDYSTGATTLSVYEGANKLSGGGGTPGFSVSVTKNNVSGSYSSGTFTPSGMSAGEGSVNFEITVTKSDGSTQTINKTATYSVVTDGASASSVSIEAESQVFRVSKSGSVSPSQIGLNSVKQNVSSVSWSASDNVSFDSTPKSGYDQSVSKSSLDANGVGQVSITASGGGDSDTLTLAIIREGSDALTPILTNENHTFTAASDGTIAGSEYSSGATDVKIYEGATQLSADSTSNPSNGTFNVSSVTTTNINASKTENASSFTISPSGGMDNSESASIDITIDVVKQNGDEATITKTVTYSKSVAGADGSDAKAVSLSAQSQIFAVNQSDSVTTVNPIKFTANKENISSGFSWATFNTNGNDSPVTLSSTNGNTATLSYSDLTGASEKEVTVRASAGGLFDEITVSIVEDGTDAVTILLSNENHTYQAQSDGTVSDYSTGKTTIKAYRGDSQLSVGSDFSVSKSESNVSGDLVGAVYTPTGMSSGEGSVEFTVTVNKAGGGTETFTKTATYSKSIAGENNQDFDFLGVDKSKIKDTAGLYTNNDFLGYFRDDANGSLNPNERARAYLDNSGNFYLNDQNDDTGLVYESNLSGGNGIFAVGDIGEAKDYHQGNSVSSSSSFLSYSKASSNSELVFKGEIDAFGRIESFNPGGELAVRIDNDETFNTPTSSNSQADTSFTLSSTGDSTNTSVNIESGVNEVEMTISGDAGYIQLGGENYDIPSSIQVELRASTSGKVLVEEWVQINKSSVSGKTVSASFNGQGYVGESLEIVVNSVFANNGNISVDGVNVKSYTPTTEINARGVQVAYTSTDYVRIGASGITSTGGIETGSGAGVNFTSEGKLYADGSALYWSSGSNLTRIDSKVVEGTSGDSDKLDGNHGSYYLDASNINAGTLGTSYVPNLSASKITSGTFDAARIPSSTQYSDSDAVSAVESSIGSSSLVAQPASSGGSAEIRFKSNVNAGSDFGLLKWYDNNAAYETGSGDETGVLALEAQNDEPGGIGDHVVLSPTGHVYLDTDDEIRKGDSSSYNVVWHEGNDGSGSGLDADSVDGIDASQIPYGNNATATSNTIDNTEPTDGIDKSGFYRPNTNKARLLFHVQHPNSSGYSAQIGTEAYGNSGLNYRTQKDGSWNSWEKIWTSDRMGTGSGLDADSVDNYEGSDLAVLAEDENVTGDWDFSNTVDVEGEFSGNQYEVRYFGDLGGNDSGDGVYTDSWRAYIGIIPLVSSGNKEWAMGKITGNRSSFSTGGEYKIYAENDPYNDALNLSYTSAYVRSTKGSGGARLVQFDHNGKTWIGVEVDAGGSGINEALRFVGRTKSDSGSGDTFPKQVAFSNLSNLSAYSGTKTFQQEEVSAKELLGDFRVRGGGSIGIGTNPDEELHIESPLPRIKITEEYGGGKVDHTITAQDGKFIIGSVGTGGSEIVLNNGNMTLAEGTGTVDVGGADDYGNGDLAVNAVATITHSTNDRYGYVEMRNSSGDRGAYLGWGNGSDKMLFRLDNANYLSFKGGAIESESYSPGFTGNGWQFDKDGNGELSNLSVRGTLLAREFEIRKLSFSKGPLGVTVGGGKVAEITKGPQNSSADDYYWTIRFEEEHGLADGDFILTQEISAGTGSEKSGGSKGATIVRQVRGEVYRIDGPKEVSVFARNSGEGRVSASQYDYSDPQVGDDVIVVGSNNNNRDSMIYQDPYGPFIDVLDGISNFAQWDSRSPKVRMGYLDGGAFGQSGVHGIGAGDATTSGDYMVATANEVKVDGKILARRGRIYDSVTVGGSTAGDISGQSKASSENLMPTEGRKVHVSDHSGGYQYTVGKYNLEELGLSPGDKISWSFYGKTTGSGYIKLRLTFYDGSNSFITHERSSTVSGTPYQRGKGTTQIPSNATSMKIRYNDSNGDTGQSYSKWGKINKGPIATDYQRSALEREWGYDGKTTIDGGSIEADTITANEATFDDLDSVSASIGGWTIKSNRIEKEQSGQGAVFLDSNNPRLEIKSYNSGGTSTDYWLYVGEVYSSGNTTGWDDNFGIAGGSVLGNFDFELSNNKQQIAGWNFNNTQLYKTNQGSSNIDMYLGQRPGYSDTYGLYMERGDNGDQVFMINGGDYMSMGMYGSSEKVYIGSGINDVSGSGIFVQSNSKTVLKADANGAFVDNLTVEGNAEINGEVKIGGSDNYRYNYNSISSGGWYRIAKNEGSRAKARFNLWDQEGGRHNNVEFTLGCSYNEYGNATFSLHSASNYTSRVIQKVRLLTDDTYDEMYVEVYLSGTGSNYDLKARISDNYTDAGWEPDTQSGNIPSGYHSREWEIAKENVPDQALDTITNTQDYTKIDGGTIDTGTILADSINTDNLFAQNIDFTGNLSQNINKKTVFQVSAEERKIMIADDGGNKTASLTKQGNLTINKIKNYQATSYDATSGNADSTPSTVKYYIDINTPQGPGRIPVYETPDTQAPNTPSNLSVSDGADFAFAEINFDAASDNGGSGINYYNIYRAGSYNGNYQVIRESTVTSSIYDGSVEAGNTYWYKVSAVDNAGNESSLSGYESVYITKTADYQPPGDARLA